MTREELGDWLRLLMVPGIGRESVRRLLGQLGLPSQVLSQAPARLTELLTVAQAQALLKQPEGWADALDQTWQWLQERPQQRAVVALGDPLYPVSLLNIPDPPVLLYLAGRLDLSWGAAHSVAVVGSRNPTPQGKQNAQQFAQSLSQAGLTIVSGLALGVDGAAHEGALAGGVNVLDRLLTVAVVGTGLDRVYPRAHHGLAHRILEQGLLISEYALGTPPLAQNFPQRNRLIAGLSHATLVVEAAVASGSLITARLAAEQGKDVLAIPGSIHAPQSRGCHALIRQGAKLVESAEDVLEEFAAVGTPLTPASLSQLVDAPADEMPDSVLEALGFESVSLDALQARTGLSTGALQARLMALELEGQLARLPGGLYQRLARA